MTAMMRDALMDGHAARRLATYYEGWDGLAFRFTGGKFDVWPGNDPSRFTADDLVAVTFLSVQVPPRAAQTLLRDRADEFSEMLEEVPVDRELHEVGRVDDAWWKLMTALKALPNVGPTTATKLYARKRPHLRPIYDSVVERYLGPDKQQWEPVRELLAGDPELVEHVRGLSEAPGLPAISLLRTIDVVLWMKEAHPEGKNPR